MHADKQPTYEAKNHLCPCCHSLNAHAMMRLVSFGPVKLPTTDLMTAVGLCAVTT